MVQGDRITKILPGCGGSIASLLGPDHVAICICHPPADAWTIAVPWPTSPVM